MTFVKNIYNLFREYNKQLAPVNKSKFLASLSYEIRETLKILIDLDTVIFHCNDLSVADVADCSAI